MTRGLNVALAAATPMTVDLNREVRLTEEGILPAGPTRRSAREAAQLLVGRQPGSELDRLVTVQDVLDVWMRRLQNPAVARATRRAEPGLAPLIAAAKADDRRTDTLPVESVTVGGDERFEPRIGDLDTYAAAVFPNVLPAIGGSRPWVEILNGTGAVGLAQTIAARIVPAGGQVTLTGNVPDFGLETTQVVYYRRSDRAAAQRLRAALGRGALKQADTPIGVVDVTILAGQTASERARHRLLEPGRKPPGLRLDGRSSPHEPPTTRRPRTRSSSTSATSSGSPRSS